MFQFWETNIFFIFISYISLKDKLNISSFFNSILSKEDISVILLFERSSSIKLSKLAFYNGEI